MSRGYTGGHLGERLEEYVDGSMPDKHATLAARHLVACSMCREDVAAEREVLRRLRSVTFDPKRQADLVADLLAVAPDRCDSVAARGRSAGTSVAVAVIAPNAPARYSGRGRGPVVCVAAALGCLGIVATVHVAPHRTAPGQGRLVQLSSRQLLTDDVEAPRVQVGGYRQGLLSQHTGTVRGKIATSGTIGP